MSLLNSILFVSLLSFLNKDLLKKANNFFNKKIFKIISFIFYLIIVSNIFLILLFSIYNLFSNFYLDMTEPQIATVSWFFEYGKPIYNLSTDAERYSFLYGHLAYFANFISMKVLSPSLFSSKFTSFTFLFLTLLACYFFSFHITKNKIFSLFLTGIISMIFISTVAAVIRISNDSLGFFLICLSLFLCIEKNISNKNFILFALLSAILFGVKPNFIISILPSAFFLISKSKEKIFHSLLTFFSFLFFLFLIFILFKSVSFTNYLSWVKLIMDRKYSFEMFVQNISFALIWIIPTTVLYVSDWKKINFEEKIFFLFLLISSTFLSITGSRIGSGTAELFSIIPSFLFLLSLSYKRKYFFLKKNFFSLYFLFSFFLICTLIHSSTKGLIKKISFIKENDLSLQISEINEIISHYPYRKIAMGYGSSYKGFLTSYLSPILTFNTNHFVIDASHLLETMNVKLNEKTIKGINDCYNDIYLIPKNESPFNIKPFNKESFSNKFKESFVKNYTKKPMGFSPMPTYSFFDTWKCKKSMFKYIIPG